MTVSRLVRYIRGILNSANADFEARQIVGFVTGADLKKLSERDVTVDCEKLAECERMAQKVNDGEPLYYLIGECEFYSLPFTVGRGVLIPQPETEILVDKALELISGIHKPQVADLCSGSGAIAIAIAHNRPDAAVDAVELYDDAFGYLVENINRNGVGVNAIKADALEYYGDYDLVVSNPPYISLNDAQTLDKLTAAQPANALFAADDGLYFYKRIAENFSGGNTGLCFEIGSGSADAVARILIENGFDRRVELIKDYNGIDRVVTGFCNYINNNISDKEKNYGRQNGRKKEGA